MSQSKYNASWIWVCEVCVILLVAFVSKWPIWDGASAGIRCFRGAFLSQCIFYNRSSELIGGIIYLNWSGNTYEAPKGFHKCQKVLFILVSPDLKESEKGCMARWINGHLEQCRVASMVTSVHLVQLENPIFSLKTTKRHRVFFHLILHNPLHNKYMSSPVL